MNNLFNKELVYRIFSVLIYAPLVILPLYYSNYASLIVYLLFISIIINEINEMSQKVNKVYYFKFFLVITVSSFFLFLFLLITEIVSNHLLIHAIIIIWLFDTFSFLGGKIIGGVKLMPKISSGKTVSGLLIGIIMTFLASHFLINLLFNEHKFSILSISLIIFLSFVGDTLVSLLKRYALIKDSGNIMPGHGGLLDRFDSFIMVFFILGIINLLK